LHVTVQTPFGLFETCLAIEAEFHFHFAVA
jgi:hypothetical protein